MKKEYADLMQKTSTKYDGSMDNVREYDGLVAKKEYEASHWDDKKAHPKNCLGDDPK